MMKPRLLCLLMAAVMLASCASSPPDKPLTAAEPDDAPKNKKITKVKNVILLIGDGMGPQQMGLLQEYATRAPNSTYPDGLTAMARMMDAGTMGLSTHGPVDKLVVDSACSATQLATGQPAPSEVIGLDANGDPAPTILERARAAGLSTGLISDTRLTHATPAAFAAHVAHRSMENEIAEQLLTARVDVMLSGGLRHWIPASASDPQSAAHKALVERTGGSVRIKSKRKDEHDLLAQAQAAGYQVVMNKSELMEAKGRQLLGLFAYSGMHSGPAHTLRRDDPDRTQPTLPELATKALEVLSADEDGFFLMIEAGQIDWAGHANDAGWLLHEMLKFDQTLKRVMDFASQRDDTLVVVTADHETGGFGFAYSRAGVPNASALPGAAFVGRAYKPNHNFGDLAVLDRLYKQTATFEDMMGLYDRGQDKSPEALAAIINQHSDFKISVEGAASVLAREPNTFHHDDHKILSADTFPLVNDFEAFYVFGEEVRMDLIGRALAQEQQVTWANGTHTHTPVAVIAYGPPQAAERYSRFMHHTVVGQITAELLLGHR